jgi:hypothetical protein
MNVLLVRALCLYVWVGAYVGFPYLMLMLWLYVGLLVFDVLFSCFFLFFPWPALEYKSLLAQGCIVGCVLGFWMFLLVFSYLIWRVCCLHEWLCGTDTTGVLPIYILWDDVYGAAVCWRGVELCFNVLYSDYVYGVEYRILKIEQYLVHLFILLVCEINMEFFKVVHMCAFFSHLYYSHCVLYCDM